MFSACAQFATLNLKYDHSYKYFFFFLTSTLLNLLGHYSDEKIPVLVMLVFLLNWMLLMDHN